MNRFATVTFAVSALFAASTTNDLTAQVRYASKSYSKSIGNSWLGLKGYAYGYMRSFELDPSQTIYTGGTVTYSSAHARGYLRATANILKSTRELGRFDARGDAYSRSNGASLSGSYRLNLAGYTMVSKSFSKTTTFPRFSKYISLFPTDPRADVPVGPFTLTLKGNAGVGIESNGFAAVMTSPAVGLAVTTKAWGFGRAKVEFGIWGFGVGAEVKAKLAQQTLFTNLWANSKRVWGSLEYQMIAVSLKLRAYAYAFWGAASYSKTVLSRSYGSFATTLIRL